MGCGRRVVGVGRSTWSGRAFGVSDGQAGVACGVREVRSDGLMMEGCVVSFFRGWDSGCRGKLQERLVKVASSGAVELIEFGYGFTLKRENSWYSKNVQC